MGGSKSRVPFHAPCISKCWSVGGKESKLGAKVSVTISFKCFRCERVEKSKVSFPPEMVKCEIEVGRMVFILFTLLR